MLERFWDWLARRLFTGPFRGDTIRCAEYLRIATQAGGIPEGLCACPRCGTEGGYEDLFPAKAGKRQPCKCHACGQAVGKHFIERHCYVCGYAVGPGYWATEEVL